MIQERKQTVCEIAVIRQLKFADAAEEINRWSNLALAIT
jgi:hypothetical protein